MELNYLELPELKTDRLQGSIGMHQDSESLDLFPENIISPIVFFKKINCNILNISSENGEADIFKNDLFQSFDYVENYLQKMTQQAFDSSINCFIPLFVDVFVNIDFDIDSSDDLYQFYNSIFVKMLHCIYYLVSLNSMIFQNYYSPKFLEQFVRLLLDESDKKDEDLVNLPQFILSKLFEDDQFKFGKDYASWMRILEKIPNEYARAAIFYELSKNPQKINLDCISDIIYHILKVFPEKEQLDDNIESMKKCSKAIINCIESTDNTLILSRVKIGVRDIFQFMNKITDLIEIGAPSEFYFQNQKERIICFCNLMSCFIKKGIISNLEIFTENDGHIIECLCNICQFLAEFNKVNPKVFDQNRYDKPFGKMLILLYDLIDFANSDERILELIIKLIPMEDCIQFALDSSFKMKKSACALFCKIIEKTDEYESVDFLSSNNNLFRLILNLLFCGAVEILESLINCVRILLDKNDCFINFIVKPDQPGEFDGLIEVLEDFKYTKIYEDEDENNTKIIDPLEDIISEIKRHSPRDVSKSYYEDEEKFFLS